MSPSASCAPSGSPAAPLPRLAARLRALPPSCGPVRLVAVDGHAGSGKTTFAARLSAELSGAPVLHLDDLATHEDFFGWDGRLVRQILTPLAGGRPARWTPYDWTAGAFPEGAGAASVLPPEPVVLIEGVGAGRRALRPYLACLLWMDMPRERAWERGLRRDGAGLAPFWAEWTRAETAHFAEDPSYSSANSLVRAGREGFEVRAGPAGDR